MPQSLENTGWSQRRVQRWTGLSLLIYAAIVAVQVVTRAMSYDSQAPFPEAMGMIARNHQLYLTSTYSGVVANILLLMVATGLYSSLAARPMYPARCGAVLLATAAIIALVSAAGGLVVASQAQKMAAMSAQGMIVLGDPTIELLREATGKIGFTLSALGVMAFSGLIASSGTLPRWLGWAGIAAGLLMFFIWVDTAAIVHRLGGLAYLLWLLTVGGWLLVKGAYNRSLEPRSSTEMRTGDV